MSTRPAPTSQKNRPIGFALLEGGSPLGAPLLLPVRPEDLAITDPYRVTTHHTLGGAYVDAFGRGIGQLTLSGTTGWQGGEAAFKRVREEFELWARLREARVKAGLNPEKIELSYVDTLNDRTLKVVPHAFTLQRSRQQPLLLRYHIQCAIIGDLSAAGGSLDSILGAFGNLGNSLSSLTSGIGQLAGAAKALSGFASVIGSLASAGAAFISKVTGVVSAVVNGIKTAYGYVSSALRPIYNLAVDLSQAGRNLFSAVAAIASMPNAIVGECARIVGCFTSLWCGLRNAISSLGSMFDIDPLFGAANCSSTSGGKPISQYVGKNAFETMYPVSAPAQIQSDASRRATQATIAMDPVTYPMTASQAATRAQAITEGVYAG